ncbi:lytic transglycosylase domain-containing protein [Sphingomonas sp. CJ99]
MGTVRVVLATASLAIAAPADAETVADWRPYIAEASARFGVPATWIERVMQAESRGRTQLNGRPIRSSAGAMGLMQLMPGTWADMRARLNLGTDPDDPRDNILAGTLYLRLMYDRFGYPGLFAAYNAGPKRYADYLAGRARLPSETVAYLASVAPAAPGPVPAPARPATPQSIFAVRRDLQAVGSVDAESPSTSSLFVMLSRGD